VLVTLPDVCRVAGALSYPTIMPQIRRMRVRLHAWQAAVIHRYRRTHTPTPVAIASARIVLAMVLPASNRCPNTRMAALVLSNTTAAVPYTHLRAHETGNNLVCRLPLEKKNKPSNK